MRRANAGNPPGAESDQEADMPAAQPVLTPPDGGETVRTAGGSSSEIKVKAIQSGGDYGVVRYTARAGEEPPLHTHTREDELVYVLEGEIVAQVGEARIPVGPGAFAALPRGVPHTFTVAGESATLLLTFVPGGLERFFVPENGAEPDPKDFGLSFEPAA
jgi:quercetin dioxygenase-like cupin family protein